MTSEELPPAARMQYLVLGGPERYTREEIATASRLTLQEVRRLWRAMGFPDVGEARAFTDADLTALLRVVALVERGVINMDGVVELARSLGRTTGRLADWQVDALGRRVLGADLAEGLTGPNARQHSQEFAELLPQLEQLLGYVWRRQLAGSLERSLAEVQPDAKEEVTSTVGFADLVSFTRLSRQMDGAALAQLVQTFESVSADLVHAVGARLVKTLGDEVMYVAETPEQGARIALSLHRTLGEIEDVPQLRIGMATGSVLTRMGDVFGTTVNRASRMTALARPGTTIVDSATDEALHGSDAYDEEFTTKALTPRPVRGFGIVRPYALTGA